MNKILPIAAVAVAVVGAGAYLMTPSDDVTETAFATADAQTASTDAAEIDVSSIQEMSIGSEDAPITIVEYASYTCPHCASFHAGAFKQIKENYIDTGKVKFDYREVYFDRYGLWASMVARCGNDTNRFFGISDILYTKQREWSAGGDPATIAQELRTIGLSAGLTPDEVDACMQDADNAQTLVGWFQQNADADDISSTPSFIINGEKYGNMNYADFSKTLDDLIAE